MTEHAAFNRTALQPDAKRSSARAKAVQTYGTRLKENEILELAHEVMQNPGLRDLKKFKDAMKKGDGTTTEYGANEIRSLAIGCLRAAATRQDRAGATARAVLMALAMHPYAPQVLRQNALSLNPLAEGTLELEVPASESLATVKKNFDAVRMTANANSIGQHALSYVEALEAREKALAKAILTAQTSLERRGRIARMYAWACIGQRADGSRYENLTPESAAVAMALDLHRIGWPDVEGPEVSTLISLVLGSRTDTKIDLAALANLEPSELRNEVAAQFSGNANLALAYHHGLLTTGKTPPGKITVAELVRVLVNEFHCLQAGADTGGIEQ